MAQDKYSQNRQLAYDLLKQEGYTDIGDSAEELFKNKANSELAYQLLSQAGYTDIGKDYNEFASMLYGPQQPSRPTAETEQVEQVEQPAKPARQIDPVAAAEGRQALQNAIASRREVSTKEDIPQATQKYMAQKPVEGGQRDFQRTQLVDQLNEAKKISEPIIAEYEKRLQEYNDSEKELTGEDNVGPWLQSTAERKAWLDEHQQEYNDAKESIQMAEARLNYYDKPRVVEEIDAQIAKNQKHVAPKAISTTGTGYFPTRGGGGYNMEESHNYEAANEILGMAKQTYQQGSKADPGYEGNGLEQVWTAARQFVEGGINNVDMGSLTYGLSEGSALIQARRVGDKYNKAIEKAGISEDDDWETAYQKAEKAYDSLTDGEKALLEALVEYSDAQIARQNDVSVASAAGAGAEQSAEFMLDFILTGGLEAVGKKAVGKLLRRQLGKKVKFGEQVLSDVVTSALRTSVMLPRNLAAYGENLTQIDWDAVEEGTNEGKIPFARSHMNAALNTALTQFIEYWSEGFGEYFAAGEKKLFQAVTKKAPKAAIGKTLTQYRGSIGQFLDHGKFNGQFNEMLEEVVGSLFNSTAGWLSGDRVGDSDAIKEFWSGENLATLFFSFLPMTAISTRTNIKAYNRMKEHYDNGVAVLNPFIEKGAISQEDLNGLVGDIENKTPEEIVSKIEDITDKARKANGGFLPQNFAQALMGYCEGTFAMGMRNDVWEDSAEKMGVVNAYSQFYANPDERAAYDLSQAEQQAHDAAIQQGYSEEDLDQDAYILAQQALANEDPVLQQYAEAKAANQGLKDGYDEETRRLFDVMEGNIRRFAVNGDILRAMTPEGDVVYITSSDATISADGRVLTPTGADGIVSYRDPEGWNRTEKASAFTGATSTPVDYYILDQEQNFFDQRNAYFEEALNTVSPLAKAKALYQMQGQNVIIEGSGAYEPVRVERLTHGGENVVISGDRDVLQGVAMAAGINSPGGTRLEIPVENLWDMLAKENDGSLSTEAPQGQPQQSSATAPQSDATRPVSGGATLDGRPIGDVRLDDENGWAYFTYQDDPERMVQVMDINEFRQKTGQAQAPAAPEAPATPAGEVPKTSTEVPEGGTPQSKIPVDKDGNKIYDAPGVEPIDAYEDMYSTEGLSEADVDEWVISQSDEAEKNRNPKIKKGQSLQEWGREKAEANRKADFWKELRDVAEEHVREREEAAKREADLQAQIEKYGVDTRGFDLTPQTTEEAVAEYLGNSEKLIDLEDAKKETLGKSKSGRVPAELFRHLGNGGILTSKGGRTIQDVANDIVGEYEGTLSIAQDEVRDIIIDYLTRYTKSEMREMIFNNRLDAALAELEQQNGTSAGVEEEYGPVIKTYDTKKGKVEVRTKVTEKDGVRITKVVSLRNGEEIGTRDTMPMPEGYRITDATNAEGGLDVVGVRELRESEDGRVGATVLARLEDGTLAELDVALERADSIPAEEAVEEAPEGTEVPEEAPVVEPEPAEPETATEEEEDMPPAETETVGQSGAETAPENEGETSETPGNSVPSQESVENVPATAADIKNVAEARAFFEKQYGKGKRADNSVRVWELTHKAPAQTESTGLVSQMAMALEGASGLTQEEAAELVTLGTQLAEDFINDGFVKFPQFFKTLVETFGDGIRPFTKSIYLGASANVSDEISDAMDDKKTVRAFDTTIDINDISDEQNDSNSVSELREPVSEPVSEPAGEQVPAGEGEVSGTDTGSDTGNTDTEGAGSPTAGDGALGSGGESVSGSDGSGNGGTRGTGTGRGRGGRPAGSGGTRGRGGRSRGDNTVDTESGQDTARGLEATEEAAAKAEEDAYQAEREAIKDETDTNKLKARKTELKSQISAITEKINLEKAKMAGQLRAIIERLRDLFSNSAKKSEVLAQEKVPYQTLSDPEGSHAFGSVVPSGSADAMRDAIKRLEAEEGKSVAEFVREELGYKSLDEMFSGEVKNEGLSSEQVDSVGLAIHQMKKGKMFIVGDMTGVGKGRQGAALIRWAKRQGKKVLFVTEKPDLFSDMYGDLADIGTKNLLPFIVNSDGRSNITTKSGEVLVRHPGKAEADELYKSESDELPTVKKGVHKGKKYDFVMMTYSQAQSARTAAAERKLAWVKQYAKDAIVICDESHNASGDSARGNYFCDIVSGAQGVTFMSATFAKRPDNMVLYALRSSMADAQMTTEDMIMAIQQYGIPMQEILASSLFKTGEMVRRERDFTDVKTHWLEPKETYSQEEIKQSRDTFDRSMGVVNSIIGFQRMVVDAIIKKMNEPFEEGNDAAEAAIRLGGKGTIREYVTTPYSSQVSNIANLMFYSIKARKAADMAIEQIKRGEKPVIAVENTLESYLKDIEGDVKNADFSFILNRGLARSLNYRFKVTTKAFNKETGKAEVIKEESYEKDMGSIVSEMGPEAQGMLQGLRDMIAQYSADPDVMPLMLSPIDYIKKRIEDAGYKCGEITGRSLQLVQAPDGTYHTEPFKADKKKAIRDFNGGEASNPLPKEQTTDAIILNTAGSTGISLHASRRFGDQRKRTMIILQPARDPNTEVQVRGRVDRTGQVSRAEYFYVTSPIPAERKVIMMLKQKLASLDANAVGTEKVSSNRVDVDDMDNKYGDEVARQFLAEHPEINAQLDDSKQIEQKKGEWIGREGLLYDLLIGIQRMSCADQEMILEELQNSYKDQIEYLNQNGINDLVTTTLNLEAVTIDSGLFIKGKDNESMSEFAHDTNIERVEVNVINKPLRSSDIYARMKKLGALEEDGTIDDFYGTKVLDSARRFAETAKAERAAKHRAEERQLEEELRQRYPITENQTEEEYTASINMIPQLSNLREKNQADEDRFNADMDKQVRDVNRACTYFKPGMPMFVPLTDELGAGGSAPLSYGRFIGFKVAKDGKPKSIKAVFAVKDSRASIEIPVVSKADVVQNIVDNTYGSLGFGGSTLRDIGGGARDHSITDEMRRQARDEWWDKMIPKDTNRQIRYMVTGNILQACGSLGKYKGSIVTFTRKDPDTGEITVERGMLLAEDFDPENFMVRSAVTKDDVWEGYDRIYDNETNISVQREGNRMIVKIDRKGREKLVNHPIMKDDGFKALTIDNDVQSYSRDHLRAYVAEENVEKALEYLYKNYSFTKGHLFVMPDSTERVDAIVYTEKPYNEVINDLSDKYNASEWNIDSKIRKAVQQYKMDVNNEELKTRIREMVQLRQAYLRKRYTKGESSRLAWQVIIEDQRIERAKEDKDSRDQACARREAIKEELASRGVHGHAMHFESGKMKLDDIIKTFNELNQNPTNAKIAKKVFAIAKRLNLDIVMNDRAMDSGGMGNNTGGQTAGDLVEYNWKYMNAEWITDQMKADTILHELIHTATAYAKRLVEYGAEHLLTKDAPEVYDAVMVLDALYNAIRRNPNFVHKQSEEYGDQYTDYGISDWYELLSEAGSNEAFREDLKKIKVAPRLVSGIVTFNDVTDRPDFTGRTQTALEAVNEQLDVLLDNFNEHSYTEMWRGTGYGQRSYQTLVSAESESTDNVLDAMEEEFDIPIHRVPRSEMPIGHKSDKGYYNPATGEVTICVDNVTDERDAIATVLHETVGHHGLRQLFGDRFNDAMVRIYAALDAEGRRWVNSYIARHPNADNTRAVEEYLSHLAESENFLNTVWSKVKEIIGKIVDALFGTDGFVLTDNELNYILRASYEHLKNPDWLNTAQGKAFDTLLKRRLGINETDPNKPTDPDGPGTGLLFRNGATGVANEDYNGLVDSWENKMLTENQDADRPVRIGYDTVMKEKGIKSISEDEDYVQRHNLASSRAESQAHEFELFRFTPLMNQVRAIQERILKGKRGKDARQEAYERILDYMYAVSGLERNAYKNAEIEADKQAALAGVKDPAERAKIEARYEAMKRDWSGITSLMKTSPANWKAAEAQAMAMVSAFEKAVGNKGMLDELWNRVRACTDYSLEHAYKYGLLTREEFERLHGTASQPRMWNYYLPLRGFDSATAEEQFSYANFTSPSANSVVVKKMNGRWTQADNPLANILNIAETEIVQGNDNWAKQALYRFTLNAGDNTLLAASEPWYVKNPATGKWSLAFPNPGESLEDFEERMKALRALDDPLAKKGRQGLKLDNIMVNKAHRNEHAIHLKVGGIDKMIWVNGDPALARAVSGIGRAQNLQWLRRAGRVLSNLFTTYSLDFTAKNLIRDTVYSFIALHIKEDKAYRHQYRKNWIKNFGYGAFAFPMVSLAAQWENGKLVQKERYGTLTPRERDFLNFMRDGGQTGYTIINSVNQIKKDLEKQMRSAGGKPGTIPVLGHYAKAVKTLNEAFELLTRFTAYQTSRDMGRSGQRAASDAKEISVNFNRRGAQSGNGIWGNIAAYLGATHYFYNAGVQGFDNFLGLFKKKPGKMSAITAGFVMMGILTPLINSMLAGLIGGGDGDDDWYWNLPEWVRRNNLVLGTGKWYVALPLPVEFRAPYGIGDIAGAAFAFDKYPNRHFGNVAGDLVSTASGILPVNPIEGYTGNGNLGDAALRAVAPDATMFFVDWATNRDYTGRPLWKENPFSETVPRSQGAYASTPKGIVAACQKLAEVSNGTIDIAPGVVRDFMNNYGGGFFRAAEDVSKLLFTDEERPRRWDNVPFFSGFTGHIDEDRSNSFAQGALYDYKKLSEGNVKEMNAILNTDDITSAVLYDEPESLYEREGVTVLQKAKIKRMLDSKDYALGKMYREYMNNKYKMKQSLKDGHWYKSREIERKGVDTLRKEWKDLRDQWAKMPDKTEEQKSAKAEMDLKVQEAWHLYYDAMGDLAEKLMDYEYNK